MPSVIPPVQLPPIQAETVHGQTLFVIEAFRGDINRIIGVVDTMQKEQLRCRRANRSLRVQLRSVRQMVQFLVFGVVCLGFSLKPDLVSEFITRLIRWAGGAH